MANTLSKMTFTAGAALTAGDLCEFDTDGSVIPATEATTVFAGVAITTVAEDAKVALYLPGEVVRVLANSSIDAGELVKVSDTANKIDPIDLSGMTPDAYDVVCGVALSAGVEDDYITVLLKR